MFKSKSTLKAELETEIKSRLEGEIRAELEAKLKEDQEELVNQIKVLYRDYQTIREKEIQSREKALHSQVQNELLNRFITAKSAQNRLKIQKAKKLQEYLLTLTRKTNLTQKSLSEKSDLLTSLDHHINDRDLSLTIMDEELGYNTNKLNELEDDIDGLKSDLKECIDGLKTEKADLKDAIDDLEKHNKSLQDENNNIYKQNESLFHSNNHMHKINDEAHELHDKLVKDNQDLEEKNDMLVSRTNQLEADIEQLQMSKLHLESSNSRMKFATNTMKKDLSKMLDEYQDKYAKSAELKDVTCELQYLKTQLNDINTQLKDLNNTYVDKVQQVRFMTAECERLMRGNQMVVDLANDNDNDTKELDNEIMELEQDKHLLTRNIAKLQQEQLCKQVSIENLNSEQNKLIDTVNALHGHVELIRQTKMRKLRGIALLATCSNRVKDTIEATLREFDEYQSFRMTDHLSVTVEPSTGPRSDMGSLSDNDSSYIYTDTDSDTDSDSVSDTDTDFDTDTDSDSE